MMQGTEFEEVRGSHASHRPTHALAAKNFAQDPADPHANAEWFFKHCSIELGDGKHSL